MPEAGFQLLNDAGTFSVTDKNPTLGFIQAGTVTCTGWGNAVSIPHPTGYEAVVLAFRGGPFAEHDTSAPGAWKVEGASGTVITWYMFARPLSSSVTGVGRLEIYDASSKCTFNSLNKWGVVAQVAQPTQASFFVGTSSSNTGPMGPKVLYDGANFPAGKDYAMISRYYSMRSYMPSAPTSTVWHYGPSYLCTTKLKVEDRVILSGPTDTNDNSWQARGQIMLVDVTGYGSGGIVTHSVTATNISSTGQAAGTVQKTSTATVINGTGNFSYLWSWVGTPTGLAIVSGSTTATVTISSTGDGQTRSGTLRCTVTDLSNGNITAYDDASVSVTHVASVVNHTVVASNISSTGNEAGPYKDLTSTATVSNGTGPFTYAWSWVGTHTGLDFTGATNGSTVSVRGYGLSQTRTGTIRCTVTDTGNGNVTSFDDASVSMGFGASPVKLTNKTLSATAAVMGFRLAGAGKLRTFTSLSGPFDEIGPYDEWLEPENSANLYQARAFFVSGTLNSQFTQGGTTTSVTATSWQSLTGGARDWWVTQGSSASFDVQIAHQDTPGMILAQATITLTANAQTHDVSVSGAFATVPNGTVYRYPAATVTGGVGPFTYAWTWVGLHAGLTITSGTTGSSIEVQSTGTNQENSGTVRCTVTDTGNGNVTDYADGTVSITHGVPP